MPISWAAALRLYGKQKGAFVVPKKGSADYDAIKKLQASTAMSSEHEIKKRASKKQFMSNNEVQVVPEGHELESVARRGAAKKSVRDAKHITAPPSAEGKAIVKGKISSKLAPTTKGSAEESITQAGDPIMPPAAGTKPLEAAGGRGSRAQQIKKDEKVVTEEVKEPVKKRRGVKSSGLTAGVETQEFLVNDNVMGGGAASAQMAGQKERLKKTLKAKPEEVKVVTVGEGEERTLEGMKTDDPKAVSGDKPFSFQALRNRLLC